MLPLKLYDGAEGEMADAIEYYELQSAGLGAVFRESVEAAFITIQNHPFSYPVIAGSNIRRVLTDRFPFAIIYRIEVDLIAIVSVFHTSRNPIIWKGRID